MSSKFRRVLVSIVESDCAFLARFVRSPGDSEFPAPPESQTRAIADAPATEPDVSKASRAPVQRRRAKPAR